VKVGDLVSYRSHKAIVVSLMILPPAIYHTLHFFTDRPSFLMQDKDGFFPGFGKWELKLVSER